MSGNEKILIMINFNGICLVCDSINRTGSMLFLRNNGISVGDIRLLRYTFKFVHGAPTYKSYELVERC